MSHRLISDWESHEVSWEMRNKDIKWSMSGGDFDNQVVWYNSYKDWMNPEGDTQKGYLYSFEITDLF